jgi:alpha-galactosidase/6-phospho-beta-glucosidase family protein
MLFLGLNHMIWVVENDVKEEEKESMLVKRSLCDLMITN